MDALAKERDKLRQEVSELRKSLESIQERHDQEKNSLQTELDEANESKDHFETQYRNLLGRVNTIKSSLGERLKADTVSNPALTLGRSSRVQSKNAILKYIVG